MRKVVLVAVLMILASAVYAASDTTKKTIEVQSIVLGDNIPKIFASLGVPQAMQVIGGGDNPGMIQILYFKGEDTLAIDVTDLPDNRVAAIEVTGNSWKTNSPIKVGDSVDKVIAAIGTPDKIDDLTNQKKWMLEQANGDPTITRLIERSSGDSALSYDSLGLYAEYDKAGRVVKSVRVAPPTNAKQAIYKL